MKLTTSQRKAAFASLQMTMAEFGEIIDISTPTIHAWLHGKGRRKSTHERIVQALKDYGCEFTDEGVLIKGEETKQEEYKHD